MTIPAPQPPPEEACSFVDYICKSREAGKAVIGDAAGSIVQVWVDAVYEAVGKALASVGTAWTTIETPPLTGGGGAAVTVTFLQESLWYYTAGLAVLGVIIGGGKMAWQHRSDAGRDVMTGLGTLAVVAVAAVTGVGLLTMSADGFAEWIIDRSTDGPGFAENITNLFANLLKAGPLGAGIGGLMTITVGFAVVMGAIVQAMLMVARAGMLVMLAGTLPTAAAFTTTEAGKAMFRKSIAWTIAFILYKPAAAIVYATAFRLTASDLLPDDGTGLLSSLVGLMMMVLALIALPALMRFVVPAVAAVSAGGGGGAVIGGALATGAISLGGAAARRGRGAGSGKDLGSPAGAGPTGSPKTGGGPTGGPTPGGGPGVAGGPAGVLVGAGLSAATKTAGAVKKGADDVTGAKDGPDGSS